MKNKDNLKKILQIIGGLISPLLIVLGTTADVFSLFPNFEKVLSVILVISAICVIAYTIWYLVDCYRKRDLQGKVDVLEQEVCKGIKMIKNDATITMDIASKIYHLEFVKEYEIISNNPRWYSGQFYCNKILDSAEEAQEYYEQHKVSWEDLNVQAHLQYKNTSDNNWSIQSEVYVKHVAEGNNYKEFHVEYKTVPDKDTLDIKKGTIVKLTYTYDVPLDIWGTYLNRYITYWQEESIVTISCVDKTKLDNAVFKLYKTNENDDTLVLVQGVEWTSSSKSGNQFSRRLVIPAKKFCCRYTVWWDAKKFFGDTAENTNMCVDESQLTSR